MSYEHDGLGNVDNKPKVNLKGALGAKPITNEIPNGTYTVVIEKAELKNSNNGKPMLVLVMGILDPYYAPKGSQNKVYKKKLFRNIFLPCEDDDEDKALKKGGYLNGDVEKLGIELMRPDEESDEYLNRVCVEASQVVMSVRKSVNQSGFTNVDLIKRLGCTIEGSADYYEDKNADTPF